MAVGVFHLTAEVLCEGDALTLGSCFFSWTASSKDLHCPSSFCPCRSSGVRDLLSSTNLYIIWSYLIDDVQEWLPVNVHYINHY